MTTYRVHFFLPYPANSSFLVMEIVHNTKHDSINELHDSIELISKKLGVDYSHKVIQ